MNNSQFQSFELLALKNTAKTVNTLVNKKNKLKSKIIELNKELDNIVDTIMKWEAPIKDRFGYSSEQLMDKLYEAIPLEAARDIIDRDWNKDRLKSWFVVGDGAFKAD